MKFCKPEYCTKNKDFRDKNLCKFFLKLVLTNCTEVWYNGMAFARAQTPRLSLKIKKAPPKGRPSREEEQMFEY